MPNAEDTPNVLELILTAVRIGVGWSHSTILAIADSRGAREEFLRFTRCVREYNESDLGIFLGPVPDRMMEPFEGLYKKMTGEDFSADKAVRFNPGRNGYSPESVDQIKRDYAKALYDDNTGLMHFPP